jgi:hypothetical protein
MYMCVMLKIIITMLDTGYYYVLYVYVRNACKIVVLPSLNVITMYVM